jgi:hypothetical protein
MVGHPYWKSIALEEKSMSNKNGNSFMETSKNTLQIIGVNVILAIFLFGCNFATGFPTIGSPKSAPPEPGIMWRKTESPPFPSTWPPTAETVWVRYTFAYGSNPARLSDGTYVTNPLSKTEWKAGILSKTVVISSDMTQADTQGVLPLDSQALKILENDKQVSAYALKITELPDPKVPATKDMLAYYQAWFKYNGAFLGLIRNNHTAFIDWVTHGK